MTSLTYRSSRPDSWTSPRPYQDANLRRMTNGPIQPMQAPGYRSGFLARLFNLR